MGGSFHTTGNAALYGFDQNVDYDANRLSRIIVAGDRVIDQGRIGIAVHQGNDGDTESIGFGNGYGLVQRIYHEQSPGKALQVKHTLEIAMHPRHLAPNYGRFLSGKLI